MYGRLKVSEFTRHAITISSGTFISQFLIVLATPLLTRLYPPSAFGELALFSSWYTILAGIFTLKLDLSIVLPPSEVESVQLVKLTILSSVFFSFLFFVGLTVAYLLGSQFPNYFFLLPFLTFIGAVYSGIQQWFSRRKKFIIAAHSGIINSVFNISACFLLFVIPYTNQGQLVFAYVIGFIGATLYFLVHFRRDGLDLCQRHPLKTFQLLRKYQKFPQYMVVISLLGVLSYQIIPIMLKQYFPIESVGFYSIASRLLVLPSIIAGTAIGDVFRVEAARMNYQSLDLRPIFLSTLKRMLLIGIPAFTILMFISPFIFRLILGKAFYISGIYAQCLCLAVFGQFMLQPFNAIYVILQEMRYFFVFQFLLTLGPVLAILTGSYFFNSVSTSLLLISFLTVTISAATIFKAYHLVSKHSPGMP